MIGDRGIRQISQPDTIQCLFNCFVFKSVFILRFSRKEEEILKFFQKYCFTAKIFYRFALIFVFPLWLFYFYFLFALRPFWAYCYEVRRRRARRLVCILLAEIVLIPCKIRRFSGSGLRNKNISLTFMEMSIERPPQDTNSSYQVTSYRFFGPTGFPVWHFQRGSDIAINRLFRIYVIISADFLSRP